MTGIFDGLSTILSNGLGASIDYAPRVGQIRPIQSVFRETPIEITDASGNAVLIDAPTWRVGRHLVPELARGDLIGVPDGRRFEVRNIHRSGSPASDGFVLCELHIREG